jgi:hypothetical protein
VAQLFSLGSIAHHEILAYRPCDFDCVFGIRMRSRRRHRALVRLRTLIRVSSAIVWRFTWDSFFLYFCATDISAVPFVAAVSSQVSALQSIAGRVSHYRFSLATRRCRLFTLPEDYRALVEAASG